MQLDIFEHSREVMLRNDAAHAPRAALYGAYIKTR